MGKTCSDPCNRSELSSDLTLQVQQLDPPLTPNRRHRWAHWDSGQGLGLSVACGGAEMSVGLGTELGAICNFSKQERL